MWFSVVCSVIYHDVRYHSCQNVVDSQGAARMVFMKRRRIKDLLQRACVVARTLNMKISRGRLAHTSKHCTEKHAARAAPFVFLIQPINSLIRGVVIAVAVVKSWTPS